MRILLSLTLLSTLLTTVWCIKCYECDSMREPRCNEYFSPKGVQQTDCEDADRPEYLQKYGQTIAATGCLTKVHEGIEGHRYFIRRSCYFGDLENTREACETPDPYLPFADLISCDVCEEDLCNTDMGHQSKPSLYTIFAFVVALIFAKMW